MDFHFVTPKASEKKTQNRADFNKLLKLIRNFIPVFLLAAMLPAFVAILVAPPDIDFITRADTDPVLRIWMEPATSITSPGNEANIKIMADFNSDSKLIPEISFTIDPESPVQISETSFTYPTPFNGEVELGSFTATSNSQADSKIHIVENNIRITAYDGPIEIKTSPARIIVR